MAKRRTYHHYFPSKPIVKKEIRCPISDNKVKLIENPDLKKEIYAGQLKLDKKRKIRNVFSAIFVLSLLVIIIYLFLQVDESSVWMFFFYIIPILVIIYSFLEGERKIYIKDGCKYEEISAYELTAYNEYKKLILLEKEKKQKEEDKKEREQEHKNKETKNNLDNLKKQSPKLYKKQKLYEEQKENDALEQRKKNRNIEEQYQEIKQEQQKQQETENEKNRQYIKNLQERANNPESQNKETKQESEEEIKKDINQLYKEQKEKAYKDFSFLKPTHGNQSQIRSAIKGYDSQYLNFLLEHQMPNKDIIYALECKSYKTNPNYNYEHAYIFTLGTEKKHYIVYENINDRSTTTILYILYKTKDNSEEEYYDIIAAMKEYMNSTTFNKRQWFHSRPYIKKNIRGRAIEVKIRLLQHRDFSEWKRNFWDAPFYKKNDINL
jgi:hypothetical protein